MPATLSKKTTVGIILISVVVIAIFVGIGTTAARQELVPISDILFDPPAGMQRPDQPYIYFISTVNDNSVRIDFQYNNPGFKGSYRLYRSTTPTFDIRLMNPVRIITFGMDEWTAKIIMDNPAPGDNYYSMTAVVQHVSSFISNVMQIFITMPPGYVPSEIPPTIPINIPLAPTILTVSDVSETGTFSITLLTISNAIKYEIYACTNYFTISDSNVKLVAAVTQPATGGIMTISLSLPVGMVTVNQYYFGAISFFSTTPSNSPLSNIMVASRTLILPAIITLPGTPRALVVTTMKTPLYEEGILIGYYQKAVMSWAAPLDTGGEITGYNIYNADSIIRANEPSTATSFVLDNGKTYSFKIKAINSAGESITFSATKTVTVSADGTSATIV